MEKTDFKLLDSITTKPCKPSLLKFKVTKIGGLQTLNNHPIVRNIEVVVLDRWFYLWQEITEVILFVDHYGTIIGHYIETIDFNETKGYETLFKVEDNPLIHDEDKPENKAILSAYQQLKSTLKTSSSEFNIWLLIGRIYYLNKNKFDERVIYDFNDFSGLDIDMDDSISQKTEDGILTTRATTKLLKEAIIKTYDKQSQFNLFTAARFMDFQIQEEKKEKERMKEIEKEQKENIYNKKNKK